MLSRRPGPARLAALAALPLLGAGLASCGSDDSSSTASDPASASASSSTSTSVSASPTGSGATCAYSKDGSQAARPVDLPPTTPAYTSPTPAEITTSAGVLHVTLAADTAPCTVNSFASLASQGFYDKTPCPRITTQTGFELLQCGDPTGTTGGGPGYSFADELSGSETYPAGTLAMANAGPDTNGSQFFIVFGNTQLPPSYTVFGRVDVADLVPIKAIAAKGSDNSNPAGGGKPKTPIDITSVSVGS